MRMERLRQGNPQQFPQSKVLYACVLLLFTTSFNVILRYRYFIQMQSNRIVATLILSTRDVASI
jgi:hypothetical protein